MCVITQTRKSAVAEKELINSVIWDSPVVC